MSAEGYTDPIYYHALTFPTNCYDPWALRRFARMLAEELSVEGELPPVYAVDADGRATTDPTKIDSKARCLAIPIYKKREDRNFLKTWPVVPMTEVMNHAPGSDEWLSWRDVDMVYMDPALASAVLDQIIHLEDEGE